MLQFLSNAVQVVIYDSSDLGKAELLFCLGELAMYAFLWVNIERLVSRGASYQCLRSGWV